MHFFGSTSWAAKGKGKKERTSKLVHVMTPWLDMVFSTHCGTWLWKRSWVRPAQTLATRRWACLGFREAGKESGDSPRLGNLGLAHWRSWGVRELKTRRRGEREAHSRCGTEAEEGFSEGSGWWVSKEGEVVMGAGSPVRQLLPEGEEVGVGLEGWAQTSTPLPPPSSQLAELAPDFNVFLCLRSFISLPWPRISRRSRREESAHTPGLLTSELPGRPRRPSG